MSSLPLESWHETPVSKENDDTKQSMDEFFNACSLFIVLYFFVIHKYIFYDQRLSKGEHTFRESPDCFTTDSIFHA